MEEKIPFCGLTYSLMQYTQRLADQVDKLTDASFLNVQASSAGATTIGLLTRFQQCEEQPWKYLIQDDSLERGLSRKMQKQPEQALHQYVFPGN
ncbi:hypothetical protein H5410_053584 [Solanum commersonii]|uniref:Uncharacterized protein n=1 Tax=Solanum commersonii TaxID=4109 RepID=A0A9J5X6A9_SOLCO|nr:hypothetical protein H5410_053584 [Solanum commersonii]